MRIPTLPIAAGVALAALAVPSSSGTAPTDPVADRARLLEAQLSQAVGRDQCVLPTELRGRVPSAVVVSPSFVRGDLHGSRIVYRVDVDTAWTGARAGEIVVRCVIVERSAR